ncbi:F-box only protein 40 isoform X2 [Hypomesus transpacificus]|nr:F-box only protein 40 isoform X2 [Hypomesus transpacificus]XP_046892534.1 F-box only protein 40 isoform X2 [Hypomesus transpacificus]
MVKNRKTPAGQHRHCDKCYSIHCQFPVEISVSCVVIKCHLQCGAVFHLCKEEEHQLLCPNEKVPCLNAENGCPSSMQRHGLAKHLEVCPASVVCCSQQWNRWPVSETDTTFYTNVLTDPKSGGQLSLDVAIALRDQQQLFKSIKMKNIFPEFTNEVEEPALLDMATGGVSPENGDGNYFYVDQLTETGCNGEVNGLSQEERYALAKKKDVEGIENYSSWEGIFQKEMQGCNQTVKNLDKKPKSRKRDEKTEDCDATNCRKEPGKSPDQENGATGVDLSRTGLAPWEDGVLERLGKEVNIAEYNMYLAHNGSMLINFGQLAACTPRERDFVYGNLEPIEVQTLHSFTVPTSYRPKRSHLIKNPSCTPKRANQSVDTSDLGLSLEDLPKNDEVAATLLCSLEKEFRGHVISETVGTEGLYVDLGTQTYNFSSAPFKEDHSLADLVLDRPQGLHVQIQSECVTRRHNRNSSAFNYMCGNTFRRDEYTSHFRNVHLDIQSCLNGWFEQHCPLAYLGCTFSQRRFHPVGHQATITYCPNLRTFALQPVFPSSLCEGGKTIPSERKRARNLDPLSSLPFEILRHIAGFLDSLTLSQVSQVSQRLREVCATLLVGRGMVSLKWEKKTYSHGGSYWKCKNKVWEFSCLFSRVDGWSLDSVSSMSEHLRVCTFYEKDEKREPVALSGMGEVKKRGDGLSLVNIFQEK